MTAMDSAAGGSAQPSGEVTARVGGHVAKPLLRGWLHLISFEVSLVVGTLALARAHGGVRMAEIGRAHV